MISDVFLLDRICSCLYLFIYFFAHNKRLCLFLLKGKPRNMMGPLLLKLFLQGIESISFSSCIDSLVHLKIQQFVFNM